MGVSGIRWRLRVDSLPPPARCLRYLTGARPGPGMGRPLGHFPLLLPPLVFLAAADCARGPKPLAALGEPGLRAAADCTREAARPVMGVLPLPALLAPSPFPLPLLLMFPISPWTLPCVLRTCAERAATARRRPVPPGITRRRRQLSP
jgi:hypothetical protein